MVVPTLSQLGYPVQGSAAAAEEDTLRLSLPLVTVCAVRASCQGEKSGLTCHLTLLS